MANWTALKAAIAAVIKTNGNKEITGAVLQSTLNTIVSNLGENATFKGVATTTTAPGTIDANVFYLATNIGVYANFNITLSQKGLYIFRNDGSTWSSILITLFQPDIGIIACSPMWVVDSNYNVTISSGQLDIYWSNQFIRINTAQQFTLHNGTGSICFDLTDNSIKHISTIVPGQHIILGVYYGFELTINGNVIINTPTDIIYSNPKKSYITDQIVSTIKEYQNFALSAVLRGNVTVNSDIVTIGVGYYYFNTKKGFQYVKYVSVSEQYTIQNDGVLTFNLSTKVFDAKAKTAVTSDEVILLFYDAVEGFSKNGLWGGYILNNKIASLTTRVTALENSGLAKGIVTHVVRGGITISGTDTVILKAGYYYFYSQNGVPYIKYIATDTTFVLSNDWYLVFDLISKNFIAQNKTSTTNDQVVLLLKDGAMGIVPSGVFSTDVLNNNLNALTTRVTNLESNTSKLPTFVTNEANATFARLNSWINGDDAFLIAQITDVHTSGSTKYLHIGYLAELQRTFGFNLLWNGGDIGLDTGETLEAANILLYNTKTQMESFVPFVLTKGNHDYGTQAIPTKTINDIFNAPQKRQFPNMVITNGCYGYIDDSNMKIRTFILNTSDLETAVYGMSQTQLQWFADNLATLQSDWGVVILSHYCVDPIGRWTSYPNGASGADFDAFRSIMASFVAKTSGNNSTSGVSWNFAAVPATVKLICSIAGDSHFNNSAVTNGINYIVRQGYGGIADSEMPVGATKDSFSYTSQCLFDILVIKKNGTAKVFRVGAGGQTRDLAFNY